MADLLKEQYEALPYPQRDPADEHGRVVMTELERLSGINHFVFGGNLDRSRKFRALVAGGGTGDALICLAYQLRVLGIAAEITYIDLSAASRKIAQARAAVHRFDNIRFETGSFLDSGRLGTARYDYINCTGVLHHLASPLDGLKALARLLDSDGGMGLMLYGALGRTGIYPVQEMLRVLAPEQLAVPERVRIARKFVAALPPHNWLKRNPLLYRVDLSDAEIFDLLLHSRDRAYSVEEAGVLVEGASLRLVSFVPPVIYRPTAELKDPELLGRLAGLDPLAQAAFAERLNGGLLTHEFYVVHAANPVSPPDAMDPNCIPVLGGFPEIPHTTGNPVPIALKTARFQLDLNLPYPTAQLLRLVDGERPLGEIRRLSSLDDRQFESLWRGIYAFMHEHGYIHISRNPMPNLPRQVTHL